MDSELARLAEQSGLVRPSIVVQAVDAQISATFRPDRALYPASMIKVPLVAAGLILRSEGHLPADPLTVHEGNLTQNEGPSPLVAGYAVRFEELCALAIAHSDNVATNVLFDVLGRERASIVVRERLGLHATGFRRKLSGGHPLIRDVAQTGRNTHPAADAARLFRAIALRSFPDAGYLATLLERQEWNTKLSAGLAGGDRFAHKTGDTEEVSHDGGILTAADGSRAIVVVYSASGSSDATDARFAALMRGLRALLTVRSSP
jgi:beta-lactamase class A